MQQNLIWLDECEFCMLKLEAVWALEIWNFNATILSKASGFQNLINEVIESTRHRCTENNLMLYKIYGITFYVAIVSYNSIDKSKCKILC